MKKISYYLLAAVFAIAFAACSGGTTKSEAPAKEPVKTEPAAVVAPEPVAPAPAPSLTPAEMLKNFQDYAKAYGEAFNSITKDPKKYSDLAKQSQKQVSDMEQIKGKLTPKQLQAYQKALDIVLKVNRGGK